MQPGAVDARVVCEAIAAHELHRRRKGAARAAVEKVNLEHLPVTVVARGVILDALPSCDGTVGLERERRGPVTPAASVARARAHLVLRLRLQLLLLLLLLQLRLRLLLLQLQLCCLCFAPTQDRRLRNRRQDVSNK